MRPFCILRQTAVVREMEKGPGSHIPIIAMTAHAMRGDEERCFESGMDGYVSKPINRKQLFDAIERLLPASVSDR